MGTASFMGMGPDINITVQGTSVGACLCGGCCLWDFDAHLTWDTCDSTDLDLKAECPDGTVASWENLEASCLTHSGDVRGKCRPLIANAEGDPTSGDFPLDVSFTGSATGGKTPYTYSWDFGDGSDPSTDQNPSHTYEDEGNYTATLTVTDACGTTDTDTVHITRPCTNVEIGTTGLCMPYTFTVNESYLGDVGPPGGGPDDPCLCCSESDGTTFTVTYNGTYWSGQPNCANALPFNLSYDPDTDSFQFSNDGSSWSTVGGVSYGGDPMSVGGDLLYGDPGMPPVGYVPCPGCDFSYGGHIPGFTFSFPLCTCPPECCDLPSCMRAEVTGLTYETLGGGLVTVGDVLFVMDNSGGGWTANDPSGEFAFSASFSCSGGIYTFTISTSGCSAESTATNISCPGNIEDFVASFDGASGDCGEVTTVSFTGATVRQCYQYCDIFGCLTEQNGLPPGPYLGPPSYCIENCKYFCDSAACATIDFGGYYGPFDTYTECMSNCPPPCGHAEWKCTGGEWVLQFSYCTEGATPVPPDEPCSVEGAYRYVIPCACPGPFAPQRRIMRHVPRRFGAGEKPANGCTCSCGTGEENIAGTFNKSAGLAVWYDTYEGSGSPTVAEWSVTNRGSCNITVGGAVVAPGGNYTAAIDAGPVNVNVVCKCPGCYQSSLRKRYRRPSLYGRAKPSQKRHLRWVPAI